MRKVLLGPVAALCVCAALFNPPAWGADDEIYGEHLLPPETLVFFSIPSVPDLMEQGRESALGQLFLEPKLQPFIKTVKEKVLEAAKDVERDLGISIDDLLALPQGEVTFAVVEKPARKLALVLMIDCGDNTATLDKLLEKMDDSLKDEGAEHSTQDVGDVEINVYKLDTQDNNPFKTLAYFTEEGYLVIGSEVAALKAIVDRWEGKVDDTFADADVFSYIMEQCTTGDDEPQVKWYFNLVGMVQAGVGMVQAQNPQAGLALGMLPILGLDRLKGMGGGMDFAVEDFDTVSKMFIYVEQPPSGVLGVFQFPPVDQQPPKWVPADAATYMSFNWDLNAAYQAIESINDSFQGPGATARIIDELATRDSGPKLHIKKDVIDVLSGRIDVVTQPTKLEGDEPPVPAVMVSLGVKDSGKMKQTVDRAAKSDGFPGKTRQVDGQTIYDIPAGHSDQSVSFAVAADALFVGNVPELLDRALRGGSRNSLADSPIYGEIAKFFPKKTSIASFQKSDTQVQAAYELLKKQDPDALDGVDPKQLPDFEVLRKYLRPAGSYAVPDKKGALIVGFSLAE